MVNLLSLAALLLAGCRDEKAILAEHEKEVAQKVAAIEAEKVAASARAAQIEELKYRETIRKERIGQIEATKKLISELEIQPKEESSKTNREILQELGLWDGSDAHWAALLLARDNTMDRLNNAAEKYRRDKSAERLKAMEERTKELGFARARLVQLLSENEGNKASGKTVK